jgi:hypothetical protein
MRRNATLIIAFAALAVPAAQAAKPPPKPPKGATLTVAVAPNPLVFGHVATVSGKLGGPSNNGITVRLQSMPYPYTGAWIARATKVTAASGAYAFSVAPDRSTRFRVATVTSPAVTSGYVALGVAWQVGLKASTSTPSRGARVRFSGAVHPAHPGGTVLLQKRTATGFKTVSRTTLRAATSSFSSYSLSIRVSSSATYRVRVPGDGAHLAGTSRSRSLTVR